MEALLRNVRPEQHLKLHLGSEIRNLRELAEVLDIMTETTFRHHVHSGRNDFSQWIKNAVKDRDLAKVIEHMKTRGAIAAAVKRRVEELEHEIEHDHVPVRAILSHTARDFAMGIIIGFLAGFVVAYWL